MTDIPKVLRFLQSILHNKIQVNLTKIPQFKDEYEINDFIIRFLLDKLKPHENTTEWIDMRNVIIQRTTPEDIQRSIDVIAGGIPPYLTLYKNSCRRFNCIPDNLYYFTFVLTLMKYKPINRMPIVFSFVTLPKNESLLVQNNHREAIRHVIRKIIRPIREEISTIDQLRHFRDVLPSYDRKKIVELFIVMQFPYTLFCDMMRYLELPIYLESNNVYNTMWEKYIKMTDVTFRSIAKLITKVQ